MTDERVIIKRDGWRLVGFGNGRWEVRGDGGRGHAITALVEELDEVRAEIVRLDAMCLSLAEEACENAPDIPLSKKQIDRIVDVATRPDD